MAKKISRKNRNRLRRALGIGALAALVVAVVVVAVLDHRVTQQFEGRRWTLPARVYAQPIELYAGQTLSAARMAEELERLGYLSQSKIDRPGQYRRRGDRIDVYVRAFRFSDEMQPARLLRLGWSGDTTMRSSPWIGKMLPIKSGSSR